MFRSVHRVLGALAAAILLTIALSGCGGGGGGGGGRGREPVHGSYSRSNPTAQDLLDHWNDPEQLRAAMGLQPLDAGDINDRRETLQALLDLAEGDPAAAGTRLRNVRLEDVEIIGERGGITYGRWTGGPAGTLNIEFDWQFASGMSAETRARMERAGKSWSWRIRDDFGTHTLERGTDIDHGAGADEPNYFNGVLAADLSTNGLLIAIVSKSPDPVFSSAGPKRYEDAGDEFEPWFGTMVLSERAVDSTSIMGHEIGHVLGIGSTTDFPSAQRYIDQANQTFVGPEARRVNGREPVPFQWTNDDREPVPPHTEGAEVDYGHLAACTSLLSYCRDRTEVYVPSELDFAYLADIGYEILDAAAASQPELYGYGAWGRYSGWGAGVERTIRYEGGRVVDAHDTLRAAADAFGMAPGASLADTLTALQGDATWSGPLIGVDLGQAMLPPVFGDAELRVELVSMDGTAVFDDLTVHADGVSSAFRAPRLRYAIDVTENAFSDENGHVRGSFFGPAHEEMAGVLDDRTATVNLLAGFGGRR